MSKKTSSPSKGKKKSRKKGKSAEDANTSLLVYRVKLGEKLLEDHMFEIKLLEEEVKRREDRVKFLKQEQETLFKNVVVHSKIERGKLQQESNEVYTRDHALKQININIETRKQLQKEVEEIDKEGISKDKEIKERERILDELIQYRDHGQHEMEEKIMKVKQDIEDEKNKHAFMIEQLQKDHNRGNEHLEKQTAQDMKKFKVVEADKALANLSKSERQILCENEWLKKEVETHRDMIEKQASEVQLMEEELLFQLDKLQERGQITPATMREVLDMLGSKSLKSESTVKVVIESDDEDDDDDEVVVSTSKWPVTQEMLLNRLTIS